MSSPMMAGNFADLLNPIFRNIIELTWKEWPTQYDKIFNVESSTRAYEKDSAISGFGIMGDKAEGTSIPFDTLVQGYDKTYTHEPFGLGARVTFEMWQDDQYRKIKNIPSGLARSARRRVETNAFNIFNRGFNSSYLGPDGKTLYATDHPLTKSGGTQANTPTVAADLSYTAIQNAITAMENWVDDAGQPIDIAGKRKLFLVSTAKKWVMKEILGSEKKPYTSDNEINTLTDEGIDYMCSPWLTSTGPWFIFLPKDSHYLNFFWRQKLLTWDWRDEPTLDHLWGTFIRFSCGWSHYMGTYGSNGS